MRYLLHMKFFRVLTIASLALIVLTSTFTGGCSGISSRPDAVDSLFLYIDNSDVYYDLKAPRRKYYLPYALSEVSGLSFKAPSTLLMIEDEGGLLYEYNLDSSRVINSMKFARSGDFEGVELWGDTLFALRSDGKLYKFQYTQEDRTLSEEIKTPLDDDNNTEGLGYDPNLKKLLIATKEDGDYKNHKVKGQAVYSLDPRTGIMDSNEVFSISTTKLTNFFEKSKKRDYDKDRFKFEPSAIAYNPIDGNYYIMASVGKLLLVVNKGGDIIASYPILPRILNQPEGICFAPNGDLYIASEGEGDKGFVMHFKMLRKSSRQTP